MAISTAVHCGHLHKGAKSGTVDTGPFVHIESGGSVSNETCILILNHSRGCGGRIIWWDYSHMMKTEQHACRRLVSRLRQMSTGHVMERRGFSCY